MKYIAVIYPGDTMKTYVIQDDRTPTLEWLQKQVGGHIEIVRLRGIWPRIVMVVNEEGLLFGLQKNEAASDLYDGLIVGNAIVMAEKGCDLVGMERDDLARVAAWTASTVPGRKIEEDE